MNAIEYTRKLRGVAAGSWLGTLLIFLVLALLRLIPFSALVPFAALLVGAIPVIGFIRRNRPVCDACGGPMRISSGYPRILYQCRGCGAKIDGGVWFDY